MSKHRKKQDILRVPPPDDAQLDFFAPLILDIRLKDQREAMERPFLSFSSTNPQKTPIEYQSPDGSVWVKVIPHPDYGMATIHDWDVMIWAASHIWEAIRNDEPHSRVIRFYPHALLRSIRRHAAGSTDYNRLRSALDRLKTTTIKTNIRANRRKQGITFGWLDDWMEIEDTETGEILCWEIAVNRWVYDGITDKQRILTIDRDYFLLRNGIDRWLYRIARKHAGSQPAGFTVSLEELHNKSGSSRAYKKWAFDVRKKVEDRRILGYCFGLYENDGGREMVHMIHVSQLAQLLQESPLELESRLAPGRQQQARQIAPEGQGAFWKAEMKKAARRASRKSALANLHATTRSHLDLDAS